MYYIRRDNIGDICYTDYFVLCNINQMIERGIPFNQIDLRSNDGQLLHAPLTLTANITDICNLSCNFCFYPNRNKNRIMDKKTIDSILHYIAENYIYEIDILGGEPLCNQAIESTLYLLNGATKIGCVERIYLSSNGLNPDNMLGLLQYITSKVILSFSVQFGSTYTCKSTDLHKTIECCESNQIEYHVSTVVDSETIKNEEDIVKFLYPLKYCRSLLLHYPNIFKSNAGFLKWMPSINEFWEFYNKLQKRLNIFVNHDMPYAYYYKQSNLPTNAFERIFCSCSAEYKKVEVMPDGTVFPCSLLNDEKYKLGNINDNKFKYKPILIKSSHSCKNTTCKFNNICKVCHAYVNDWGEDTRCHGYSKK